MYVVTSWVSLTWIRSIVGRSWIWGTWLPHCATRSPGSPHLERSNCGLHGTRTGVSLSSNLVIFLQHSCHSRNVDALPSAANQPPFAASCVGRNRDAEALRSTTNVMDVCL